MSGIIGGAGSKSGVIGTTELDYEEGTWTPTTQDTGNSLVPASTTSTTYTKIGRVVVVHGEITFATNSSTAQIEIEGLPFTDGTVNCGGGSMSYMNDSDSYFTRTVGTKVRVMTTTGTRKTTANLSGDQMNFTLTYSV